MPGEFMDFFIRLHEKGEADDETFCRNYKRIEKTMEKVLKKRLKIINTEQPNRIVDGAAPRIFDIKTGRIIKEKNLLWDALLAEGKNSLLDIISGKIKNHDFQEDKQLEAYLYTVFMNIIQQNIYDDTPGLESRKRQVHQILAKHCDLVTINKKKYWKLRQYSQKDIEPAALETLLDASYTVNFPEIHTVAANPDGGQWIREADMEEFIVKTFELAGGMVKSNDVFQMIQQRFGLQSATVTSYPGVNDEDSEDFSIFDVLDAYAGKNNLTHEQEMIIVELYFAMPDNLKKYHYWKFCKDKQHQEIAEITGVAGGTITNRARAHERFFSDFVTGYFQENTGDTEQVALLFIKGVTELIDKENEVG